MSEYKLSLKKREITGRKAKSLRKEGLITSIVFGGKTPILTESEYVPTEKTLAAAGYHSPIDLDIDGKKQLAIVKHVQINPVSRQIINVEFQAVSAKEAVTAMAPVTIINYEASEASKTYHFAMTQSIEELEVKAKPADLPKDLEIDASSMMSVEDKLTIADIVLSKGVELADKELDETQVVASLYDPAAEAEKREAEAEEPSADASDVPTTTEDEASAEEAAE